MTIECNIEIKIGENTNLTDSRERKKFFYIFIKCREIPIVLIQLYKN